MPRADFITSVFFLAFGIAVLMMSVNMPTFAEREVNPFSAPGIVPGFLGAVIAFLGAVLFIRSILRKGYKLNINRKTITSFVHAEETRRLGITILVSIFYAGVLLGRIPYPISTGIYVIAFVFLFDINFRKPLKDQWKRIVIGLIVAVVTAASVTLVFRYIFLVNLPG